MECYRLYTKIWDYYWRWIWDNHYSRRVKRKTNYPIEEYANSISKLFNFKDKDFKAETNDGKPLKFITSKYENIKPQFEWVFMKLRM